MSVPEWKKALIKMSLTIGAGVSIYLHSATVGYYEYSLFTVTQMSLYVKLS